MMNYNDFKEAVVEKFSQYLPEQFRDKKIVIRPCTKTNRTLDAIEFCGGDDKTYVTPTLYIDYMYDDYKESNDLEQVLLSAGEVFKKALDNMPSDKIFNFENAKDNIIFCLINTEQNKELLSNVPHHEFLDLSVIYRLVVELDDSGLQSAIVTNGLAERLGLDDKQLYLLAKENTKRILPQKIISMQDMLLDMLIADGMPAELAQEYVSQAPSDHIMWVITNVRSLNGAANILYEEQLYELSKKLGSDLYILPSSINECIAVKTSLGDPYELAKMVYEINGDQVILEERLGNQVYYYDSNLRKISLATDTPYKKLDDK